MEPRWVREELRRLCREIDAGVIPSRPRLGRALRTVALPVAMGLSGAGGCATCDQQPTPPAPVAEEGEPPPRRAETPRRDGGVPERAAAPAGDGGAAALPSDGGGTAGDGALATIGHGSGIGNGVGVYGAPFPGQGTGRSPGPVIILEPPDVAGALAPIVVRRYLRRHMNTLKGCYEERVEPPAPERHVVARLVVSAAGEVSEASFSESSFEDRNAESCLLTNLRSIRFPPDDGGSQSVVTVRMSFRPRAEGPPSRFIGRD